MKLAIKSLMTVVAAGFLIGGGINARAEEPAAPTAQPQSAGQGSIYPTGIQDRIAKWKQLKQEHPEEFAKLVSERKQKIKEKLQDLKAKNPEKYNEFKKKIQHNRIEHLRKMHQENPERFNEFMKNHPKAADRWKNFKEHRGEYRHEGLQDRREDFRDKREDYRDMREDIRDHREDVRDRREDKWDARHDGGRMGRLEDRRDKREDRLDRKEDRWDRRNASRPVAERGYGRRGR